MLEPGGACACACALCKDLRRWCHRSRQELTEEENGVPPPAELSCLLYYCFFANMYTMYTANYIYNYSLRKMYIMHMLPPPAEWSCPLYYCFSANRIVYYSIVSNVYNVYSKVYL